MKQLLKSFLLLAEALILLGLFPVFGEQQVADKPTAKFFDFFKYKAKSLKPEDPHVVKKPTEVSGTRGKGSAMAKEQPITNVPSHRQPRIVRKGR